MIYTAPRQGLFAVAIVSSLCLHVVFLVISTEQQITNNRAQKGERLLIQLVDEASLAIAYDDRVSLSVLANRYTSEYDVTSLVVRDVNNVVLTKMTDSPNADEQGVVIKERAVRNNTIIGEVQLTMQATNRGEIFKRLWFFVLCFTVVHIFIWMFYGRIARPTKEQLKMLSKEIHERYFAKYAQYDFEGLYAQLDTNNEHLKTRPTTRSAKNYAATQRRQASTTADSLNRHVLREGSQSTPAKKSHPKSDGFRKQQSSQNNSTTTKNQNAHSGVNSSVKYSNVELELELERNSVHGNETDSNHVDITPAPISNDSQNHQQLSSNALDKAVQKQDTSPIPNIIPNPLNVSPFMTNKKVSTDATNDYTTNTEATNISNQSNRYEQNSVNSENNNTKIESNDLLTSSEDTVNQELAHFKKKDTNEADISFSESSFENDNLARDGGNNNQHQNLESQNPEQPQKNRVETNTGSDTANIADSKQHANEFERSENNEQIDKKWRANYIAKYNDTVKNINYAKFQKNIKYLKNTITVKLGTFFSKLSDTFDSVTKKIMAKINKPSEASFVGYENKQADTDDLADSVANNASADDSITNTIVSDNVVENKSITSNNVISDSVLNDNVVSNSSAIDSNVINSHIDEANTINDNSIKTDTDINTNTDTDVYANQDIEIETIDLQSFDTVFLTELDTEFDTTILETEFDTELDIQKEVVSLDLSESQQSSTELNQSFVPQKETEKTIEIEDEEQKTSYSKPSYTMTMNEDEQTDKQEKDVQEEKEQKDAETKKTIVKSKPIQVMPDESIRKSGAEPITSQSVFKSHDIKSELSAFISQNKIANEKGSRLNTLNISSRLSAKKDSSFFDAVKSHNNSTNGQSKKSSRSSVIAPPSIAIDDDNTSNNTNNELSDSVEPLHSELSIENIQIQIQYVDKRHLINMLTKDKAKEYFNSCNDVLNMACQELLSLPNMENIQLINHPAFKDKGAIIELQAKDKEQLAQAGLMLGVLLQSTNEFFHEARREVKMFSLNMIFGINKPEQSAEMKTLLDNKAKANELLLLLPHESVNILQKTAAFTRIGKPKNSIEKQCLFVGKLDTSFIEAVDSLTESVFDKL